MPGKYTFCILILKIFSEIEKMINFGLALQLLIFRGVNSMRHPLTLFIFVVFIFFPDLRGQGTVPDDIQEQFEEFDKLFGLDQRLINGVMYRVESPGINGHPFLDDAYFSHGSIQIEELWFADVELAYNVYSQNIVLKYQNVFDGYEYIELQNEFIRGFRLGSRCFEKRDFPLTGEQFFQVIDAGELKCYYKWTKSINESVYPYTFYEPSRKFYLFRNDQVYAFKFKAAFIKLFPERSRRSIRNHFRETGIRLRDITDSEMLELLHYCIELNEE